MRYRTSKVVALVLLQPGDHIRRREGVYDHHMLVIEVIDKSHLRVIHYTTTDDYVDGKFNDSALVATAGSGTSSGISAAGEVRENAIEVDLAHENIEKLEYPPDIAVYTGWEAVERARKRLGETEYSLLFNNCESLVNWAILDKNKSNQGDAGVVVGAALGAGVVGAVAYGLYSVLSGRKTEKK